jgi:hypothetical protein
MLAEDGSRVDLNSGFICQPELNGSEAYRNDHITQELRGEGHPLLATLALGYIDEAEFRAVAGKHHPEIDVEGWCDLLRDD